jgi:glucose-1-phosphate adenylyltransferase
MGISREALAAIVLAGGRGKRMGILCANRAKPALPFGGNRRVIDFVLDNCLNSGSSLIAVLTDYQGADLAKYLEGWRASHGGASLAVLPPRSGSYRGTADAVYQNLDYVLANSGENVLIGAGDHVYEMDYREMLGCHLENDADVTIASIPVPIESAHRFGVLDIDGAGRVKRFVEKSSEPISNLASMGIYIFKRSVLLKRLVEDAANPNSPHDFGYAVLPGMIRRDRVFSYTFQGYWRDIGTIDSYYQANMELLNASGIIRFRSDWPFSDARRGLLTTKIRGGAVNSILGEGCTICGLVQNSILGEGVLVGEGTVIRDSLIMSGGRIGSHCNIERHILDENVRIGSFSQLLGHPEKMAPEVVARDASISLEHAVRLSAAQAKSEN